MNLVFIPFFREKNGFKFLGKYENKEVLVCGSADWIRLYLVNYYIIQGFGLEEQKKNAFKSPSSPSVMILEKAFWVHRVVLKQST